MDPLTTSAYTGVEESLVIVSADDPDMWSSQNEQDNRWYGIRSYIPVLEPGSVLEIKDITIEAFNMSSKFKHPVILRTTTRLSHTRAPYEIGKSIKIEVKGKIVKNPKKYSVIPAHARLLRREMLRRWDEIVSYYNKAWFNSFEGDGRDLIITSGLAYGVVKDVLDSMGIDRVRVLKLCGMVPLPHELVRKGLEESDRVLIVEELEPVVETLVKSLAYDEGFDIEIIGKDYIPVLGELTYDKVGYAVSKFFGREYIYNPIEVHDDRIDIPPRPPVLCPGCPHRGTFYALRRAVAKSRVKPIYNGDIGCYSLGILPPFNMQDTIVEMGGSIGLSNGFAHILNEREVPIAIIGDSTFFHSGVPPLINAVYNKAPMLVLVLDNRITAMTGGQPHPGTGYYQNGREAPYIDIASIARGIGVKYVYEFDPFNIPEAENCLVDALGKVVKYREPVLVIAKRACTLYVDMIARRRGIERPLYAVDDDKCTGCGICYNAFSCPAIIPVEDGKAVIEPTICVGCGECVYVCPYDAFKVVRGWSGEYKDLWW
jgi:indolepyruvate ferredoxin oxidoreductase alpha subunit